MTTEQLARAFRYRKGSILSPWRDVSRDAEPQGDCQDLAFSVLCLEAGVKALAAALSVTPDEEVLRKGDLVIRQRDAACP